MYGEREFKVPADRAYWSFLEVLAAFGPSVTTYYGPVRAPFKNQLRLERTDDHPADTHHLILQCTLVAAVGQVKVGGPLHVHFKDLEMGEERRCAATFDVGVHHDFGGAFYRLLVSGLPGPLWSYVRWFNRTTRFELRVEGRRIPFDSAWKTKEAFLRGMGMGLLSAVADVVLDRLGDALAAFDVSR